MLFTMAETEFLRPGGMLIKSVEPRYHMVDRPSGSETIVKIKSAQICFLISWYSSHEKDDAGNTIRAIHLADLEIEG